MGVCDFCGKEMPNQSSFCGHCSRSTGHLPEKPESTGGLPRATPAVVDANDPISAPDWGWEDAFPSQPAHAVQVPASDEDEDEEKYLGASPVQGGYAPPSTPPYVRSYSPATPRPYYLPRHQPRPPAYTLAGGCAPAWLIFLFASIFITSCIIGLGLTVGRPNLSFQPGQAPTTSTPPTDSFQGTPALSPSTGPLGLSCISPTSITLGPVSEGYNQGTAAQVSLCAGGSRIVNWTATWDQNQAPWLRLDHSSGDIPAPGQQQINVSALAASMKPGTYSATVTFSSQQSSTVETLKVTFTIQAGCIHTSQQEYSFTGVARVSDPQKQALTVSNCGGTIGSWSTAIYTNDKVNWLSVAPTNGALNGGATQSVAISVSNLKTQLPAGTYGGRIVFNIGSSQVNIYVTLIVEPGPQIILVSPASGSFNAKKDCTLNVNLNAWICIASIRNGSNSLSLNWKASSSGLPNITFKPSGDTIPANGGERVEITIPENTCQTPTTLTFTGPANAVNISWSCSLTA